MWACFLSPLRGQVTEGWFLCLCLCVEGGEKTYEQHMCVWLDLELNLGLELLVYYLGEKGFWVVWCLRGGRVSGCVTWGGLILNKY